MQKAILKLYIKEKRLPLFECEIVNKIDETLDALDKDLNDRSRDTVKFGSINFKRDAFHYYIVNYK